MHSRFLACLPLLVALIAPALCIKDAYNSINLLRRRVDTLEDMVHRRADEMTAVRMVARMPQADAAAPAQSAAANLTGSDPASIDQDMIDATVSAACNNALNSIESVTNEAGFLGCYNLPFLNTNTGVFEADLRLYQLSEPSGAFAGVRATDVSVQLSYPHAAFSVIPQNAPNEKRGFELDRRQDGGSMDELQNFLFVGQVSSSLTLTKLTDTDLMALLIPSIELSTDREGSTAITNLTSASMIFFVSGIFEGQSVSGAAAAEPTAAAAAAANAAEFTLPGTTFGIFPVGFIITSVWTLLFLGAVGYGTWGRIQFRDQFRTRKQRAVAAGRA